MANHVRQQLREALAALLTGLATTGANVRAHRAYANQTYPALAIYTAEEEVGEGTVGGLVERRVAVRIEGAARAIEGVVEDVLDTIAKEVEVAINLGLTVGSVFVPMTYQGMTMEMDADGDKPIGVITLNYEAVLCNQRSTPDIAA